MGMVKPVFAVIDADPTMCSLLETVLVEAGFTVRCWDHGLTAFDQLVKTPPNLIILDLRLGEDPEAGWQMLSLLRTEQRTAAIPVILLSADREFLQLRDRILRTRKQATPLFKPFTVGVLLDHVHQLLDQASQEAAQKIEADSSDSSRVL
jgi:DNA-binding response OmpR family regulator